MSAHEITGIRDDERISLRHRNYFGREAPLMNIDSVWMEYEKRIPCAYVDYKHQNWQGPPDLLALKPLIWTADTCQRPAFVVRYADDFSWYDIYPLNGFARRYVPSGDHAHVTEKRYVAFRYALAGRTCPQGVLDNLNG